MGITAENVAEEYNITREEMDEFSAKSQNKAEVAKASGRFENEIVPVEVPQRRKDPIIFKDDEFIREGVTAENLAKLRPAFKKDGKVTAGSSSGINDGAAALVVMSKEKAIELGVEPLVTIVAHASAGVEPRVMGTGPIAATKKVLAKTDLTVDDLDLIEANEAFAAQAIAVNKTLGFDENKVNVNGGAIAIGHPIGASGARILVTLIHEMLKSKSTYGLATLCIGGGMGEAVVIKK